MQEVAHACLTAACGYVTFMEYVVALEVDAKANTHCMSIASARAQQVRKLLVPVEVEAAETMEYFKQT